MVPQEQKPKRSLLIWMRVSTGFIALLAMLWRLIVRTWSILIFGIVGIVVGVLGNVLFTVTKISCFGRYLKLSSVIRTSAA